MGRHSHDDASATADWEEPPPVAPLWRAHVVTSAVLLLAVIAAAWWAVSWLTSPAGPAGPAIPQAVALDGQPEETGKPGGGLDAGHRDGEGQGGESQAGTGQARPHQAGPGNDAEGQSAGTPATAPGAVIVHVAGEVHEPGLVELPAGSRVADALSAAGGPTTRAQLDLLNLAAPAVDASQILVPGPDTRSTGGGMPAGTSSGAPRPGEPGASGPDEGTVNVNTADAATLEQLPGIGPALAARIVEHRQQVGPYGSMDDLDAVSGIGPAMMERLEGLVSW